MFALGRSMARRLVGEALQIDPAAWLWREGPHGRPEIGAPATDWHFNLSHSAGLVVCAIGRTRELGVDLEDLERRPPDPALVARYCSPAEASDVLSQGAEWSDRFLRYWTLKESYLKARGLGISVPLAEISFALNGSTARIAFDGSLAGTDDRWLFHIQPVAPHHLLAVAVAVSDDGAHPSITVLPYR
jgi:4'-phosphopantetheinyl transferase